MVLATETGERRLILSAFGQAVLPRMKFFRTTAAAPISLPSRSATQARAAVSATADKARRTRTTHALLADAAGVWGWTPGQWQSSATRHADLYDWIERHPFCDVRLWVSGELLRNLGPGESAAQRQDEALPFSARDEFVRRYGDEAAGWAVTPWTSDVAQGACALAGIDLDTLTRHARNHHVQLRSVVPWWYHAVSQAKRCVNALNAAPSAEVGVVEGRQVVWVSMIRGLIADVRQCRLADASVSALGEAMGEMRSQQSFAHATPVVLGQGLADGARTRALRALVLGRLDGDQPPHWLRP